MAGQGSLRQWILPASTTTTVVWGWRYALTIFCLVCLFWVSTDKQTSAEGLSSIEFDSAEILATSEQGILDIRLDCRWSSDEACFWNVRLRLIDPEANESLILDLENHSRSDRTTGAFQKSADGQQITFRPRFKVKQGVARFRVRATREAKLSVELLSDGRNTDASVPTPEVREIPLADLLDGQRIESEIDDEIATWSVQRVANDQIRLSRLRSAPVYEPGEELKLQVCSNALKSQSSGRLILQHSIVRVSHDETVSLQRHPIHIDSNGDCPAITIHERVPEAPGIYELRCQIIQDDEKIWARLRKRDPPIAHIGRPFLVMRPEGNAPTNDLGAWEIVGVIRPSESSWSVGQWLPKPATRFISGSSVQIESPQEGIEEATHLDESVSVIQANKTFQATLPVMRPGIPHKVNIRFPAAKPVRLRINVGGIDPESKPAVSFILSDPDSLGSDENWQEYTFVHYPVDGDQIWLTNLSSTPFQFESISVEAGPTHLAENIKGDLGSDPEQVTHPVRKAVLQPADIDWVDRLTNDVAARVPAEEYDPATIAMYKLWIAVDRLRDHAIANGLNSIMLPANTGGRTWFKSQLFHPIRNPSDPEGNHLATALKLLTGSGLEVYVDFNPNFLLPKIESTILDQPSLLRALTRVHAESSDQYSLLRPIVQESLKELLREIYQQCGEPEHFAGIALQCGTGSHAQPPQQLIDDVESLILFANTLKVSVDPKQLQVWASREGSKTVEGWVQDETQQFFATLAEINSPTPLFLVLDRPTNSRNEAQPIAIPSLARFLAKGLIPGESLRSNEAESLAKGASLQQQLASISSPQSDSVVFLRRDLSPNLMEPQAKNASIAADASRIIDQLDPSTLVIQQSLLGCGLPNNLSLVLSAFESMPRASMQPVPPIDAASQTVHLRSGQGEGHLYLSIMGAAPWTSDVDIETSQPIQWESLGQGSNESTISELTETRTRITVPSGHLMVLRSQQPAPNAKIRSWTTRVSGGPEALEDIKRKVTMIVERIGILSEFESYDALNNGSFEQSGGMGLVGWMHAQHPVGCVRIDDSEHSEGKHSVLLTTDVQATARTWIVSEMISPPKSGRLAVSLACRAEAAPDASPHRLKVSIEATHDGNPIRFSSELDVPSNGQWGNRDVVLEADGIEAAKVDSLRLTIDSLSGGRVWIDDIRLHDKFPTAKERAELQSQAFLAVQGLQRGNLAPSGRLLQNHWARHLLINRPAKHTKRVIEAVQPTEEVPSVAERIRSWIPRPLRF